MSVDELTLTLGETRVAVAPARGGIVSGLSVGGLDVLALDRTTLEDPTKNVRGGIPWLFPFAGRLEGDRLAATGTTMKQHGYARNRPWSVAGRRPDLVRLALAPDADARAAYPFDHSLEATIRALPRGVSLELVVTNAGREPLPLSPGWHPYFRCPAARKAEVSSDVPGLAAGRVDDAREHDFGLVAPASGRTRLEIPGLGAVRLEFSPVLRHLQVWALPGKDFVCVEPFLGPANAINTERRLVVPPGEARDLWMRIELD